MDAPLADPACPRCGGSGWVRVEDGGAGAVLPCACQAERVVPHHLATAGIPARYAGCTLQNFTTTSRAASVDPELLRARQVAQQYVESFLSVTRGGFDETGLLFVGRPGVGKTHLAVAVLAELIRTYRIRGRFVDFTQLVHRIQSTFDPASPESKRDVLDPVIEAPVLVLDELGALKPTPFVNDTLYLVLNSRYVERRPTLFTTNFFPGKTPPPGGSEHDLLALRISPPLLSRLHQMARPVVISSEDYREVVAQPGLLARRGG